MLHKSYEILRVPLLGDMSRAERWSAAREMPNGINWLPWVLDVVLFIVVLALLYLLFVKASRKHSLAKQWVAFDKMAEEEGLTSMEVRLAKKLVRFSYLKSEFDEIFSLEAAFNDGVSSYLHSKEFTELEPEKRTLENDLIGALRSKLGFYFHDNSDENCSTKIITPGVRVGLLHQGDEKQSFNAKVVRVKDEEIDVTPFPKAKPHVVEKCVAGSTWIMRYFDGKNLWEFNTPVLVNEESKKIKLAQCEKARLLNRRRFPRVAVDYHAALSLYSFNSEFSEIVYPEWIDAKLVQLAGYGMLVRMMVKDVSNEQAETLSNYSGNDLVLLITHVADDKVMRFIGKIRRFKKQLGHYDVALELEHLSAPEISELIHATNFALSSSVRRKKQTVRAGVFTHLREFHKENAAQEAAEIQRDTE